MDLALGNTPVFSSAERMLPETAGGTARNEKTAEFGDLVFRHQNRLFNAVLRIVETREDAADVVQDAFVNAFTGLQSFKGESNFYTWLYRIAYNLAISRKRKKRPVASLDDPRRTDLLDTSGSPHPSVAIERREDEASLFAALDSLSPKYRDVLVMRDLDGQGYKDIAVVLAVPMGTIRSRLHRARLQLRHLLNPDRN
jgi:RNA polymerase sigma-70 factor, ECF subfamily